MIAFTEERLMEILKPYDECPQAVVEVLQDIQESLGYLPREAMVSVSERLSVPLIEVYRVANFYKAFSLAPRGEHVITVCTGTACHVRGAPRMLDEVSGQLGIKPGETTADGVFTIESVACLGACALGPVVVLDGVYHDHMTPGKLRTLIQSISDQKQEAAGDA